MTKTERFDRIARTAAYYQRSAGEVALAALPREDVTRALTRACPME